MDPNVLVFILKVAKDLDDGKGLNGIKRQVISKKFPETFLQAERGLTRIGLMLQGDLLIPKPGATQFTQSAEELQRTLDFAGDRAFRELMIAEVSNLAAPVAIAHTSRTDPVYRGIPFDRLLDWWKAHRGTFPPLQTMHAFVEDFVKPKYSEVFNVSVAESEFKNEAGLVDVFLNHSWSTPLAHTMEALTKLFDSRDWNRSKKVFICSLALSQGKVDAELGDDAEDSPFVKVLKNMKSRGVTDFATNVEYDANLFKRGWVVLEDSKALLLDFEIIFITPDGELNNGNAPPRVYQGLFENLSNFSVQQIKCSFESDRAMILQVLENDWKDKGGLSAFERTLRSKYRRAIEDGIQVLRRLLPYLDEQIWLLDTSVGGNLETETAFATGAFGKVVKVSYEGATVVAKCFKLTGSPEAHQELIQDCERELLVAHRFRHPCIVRMFGLVEKDGHIAILQEYCDSGNMRQYLDKQQPCLLPTDVCQHFSTCLAAGLSYMHRSCVAHRDIKSPNIVLHGKDLTAKITDFGLSKLHHSLASMTGTSAQGGSPLWSPPEFFCDKFSKFESIDHMKLDVWSFGVVLYEILSLNSPWKGLNPTVIPTHLRDHCTPASWKEVEDKRLQTDKLRECMASCFRFEPKDRPSMFCVRCYIMGLIDSLDEKAAAGCVGTCRLPSVVSPSRNAGASSSPAGSFVAAATTLLAGRLQVDSWVCRGPGWRWGNQDGDGGRGTVLLVEGDWVKVRWGTGVENWYRTVPARSSEVSAMSPEQIAKFDSDFRVALERAQLKPKHLDRTFGYWAGTKTPHFSWFDIREEVCQKVGGFYHGQVVKVMGSHRAVVVGVKPDDHELKLWFHADGADGAGLFQPGTKLTAVSYRTLAPVTRTTATDISDDESDNRAIDNILASLEFTFGYQQGRLGTAFARFDIRDHVCQQVGGFKHGDVVRIVHGQDINRFTVIGVQLSDDDLPSLFVHHEGDRGAGTFPRSDWTKLRSHMTWESNRQVQEASPVDDPDEPDNVERLIEIREGLMCNFPYLCGVHSAEVELFDIRDDICMEVGGFKHGQIVKIPHGGNSTVIGVRPNNEGFPQLFFHVDGSMGAGIFPQYKQVKPLLRVVGSTRVKPALHD